MDGAQFVETPGEIPRSASIQWRQITYDGIAGWFLHETPPPVVSRLQFKPLTQVKEVTQDGERQNVS